MRQEACRTEGEFNMSTLTIDPEFRDLLPPLTAVEMETLEHSIEVDGQRDPIIVWANNNDTIIDGHNRYACCIRLGITPKVKAMKFADRGEVLKWIYMNQQGRRNITPEQLSYIRGKVYNLRKKAEGAPSGNRNASKQLGQDVPVVSTAEQVASEFGVSDRTIKRDAKFAAACDANPEKKQAMFTRTKRSKGKPEKKSAKKSKRDKGSNGHSDGGWAEALEQAAGKPHVGKEDIAKLKGISDLITCRKGLSVLAQANGFIVERLAEDKYRVRRAVVLPVDQATSGDVKILSEIKREMEEFLTYLKDKNCATMSHDFALKYTKKILKTLEHV